jgi:hypothetical protein
MVKLLMFEHGESNIALEQRWLLFQSVVQVYSESMTDVSPIKHPKGGIRLITANL